MHHRSRFTKSLHGHGKDLQKLAARSMPQRNSTSLLYRALFIAGSAAAGFLVARYLRSLSTARTQESRAEPLAANDDFSEPVVVGGAAGSARSASAMQRAEDWLSERTEYFAADTSSAPAPTAFSTDNPDIPTLYPERDGVERQRSAESQQHKP